MTEQKELFYIGLQQPSEFRKEVLQCSKDVITALKRYENIKEIRREKAETLIKVKSLFDHLTSLSNRLKQLLPKTKLPEEKREREPVPEIERPTTLDKLEKQLEELEKKLQLLK